MRARVGPETWQQYESVCRVQIAPRCGRIKLSALRPHHLQRALDQMVAEGAAPASVHKAHRVMAGALRQAVRWQLITTSPVVRVSPPRVARPKLRVPDTAEMRPLTAAAAGTPHELHILLAATTGARRGEIVALRWHDVDLDAATVSIVAAKTDTGRRTAGALGPGLASVGGLRHERLLHVAEFRPAAVLPGGRFAS
jgi:integrase